MEPMNGIEQYIKRPQQGAQASAAFDAFPVLPAEWNNGAFAIVEHPLGPHILAAPPHTHTHEDETTFVLSGEIGIRIGEEEAVLGPGCCVFKPRGVPHTFWNAGESPARVLEIISPAGFERYFDELIPLLKDKKEKGQPDISALMALARRYGLEMDFASIPGLLSRHKLVLA